MTFSDLVARYGAFTLGSREKDREKVIVATQTVPATGQTLEGEGATAAEALAMVGRTEAVKSFYDNLVPLIRAGMENNPACKIAARVAKTERFRKQVRIPSRVIPSPRHGEDPPMGSIAWARIQLGK